MDLWLYCFQKRLGLRKCVMISKHSISSSSRKGILCQGFVYLIAQLQDGSQIWVSSCENQRGGHLKDSF